MLKMMSKIEKILGVGCVVVILMHLFASFFPNSRLWGVNYFLYFPLSVGYILSLFGLLFLFPPFNRAVMHEVENFLKQVKDRLPKINRYISYALSSLLCAPIFWLLREKTHLLGDSSVRAGEIEKGIQLAPTEPLDVFLHSQAYKLFHSFWSWDGFTTYAFLSCLAGAIFIFFALLLSDQIGQIKKGNLLAFGILATTGGIQLFFGYVESYSYLYASIIAYLFFCVRYLKGKCSFAMPCLVYLIASSLHVSGFFLLPSLIYLFMLKNNIGQLKTGFETRGLIFLLITLFLSTAEIWLLRTMALRDQRIQLAYFLIPPLGGAGESYTLFSSSHLLDVLNEQFLIFPVAIAVWSVILFFWKWRVIITDELSKFFISIVLGSFLFAMLVDPKLGYARDWDLFAASGIGYTVLGAYLLIKLLNIERLKNLNYAVSILIFSELLCVAPWVLVNSSEGKSIQRFEHLLSLDKKRSAYGHEILARYYQRKKMYPPAIKQYELATQIQRNPRYLHEKATLLYMIGQNSEALKAINQALEIDSSRAETYNTKGVILQALESYGEAEEAYKKALKLEQDLYEVHYNLGILYSQMEKYQEAKKHLEIYLKLSPHDRKHFGVKQQLDRLKKLLQETEN
jgi:hypothetical protein